jgi:hypothetical protein
MNTVKRKRNAAFSVALGISEAASLLGLAYCVLALIGLHCPPERECALVSYGVYFATVAVCIYGLFKGRRWGVYGLGAATFSIAAINLAQGAATWYGFWTGILLIATAVLFLRPAESDFA